MPLPHSRRTRLLIAAMLAALLLTALVLLLTQENAYSYPEGWTSDNIVAPLQWSEQVDVASDGDIIHVVWGTGAGQIFYARSTDRGSTWSQRRIDLADGGEDSTPQISVGEGQNVYLVYSSKDRAGAAREVLLRVSENDGTNWVEGYVDFISDPLYGITHTSLSHGTAGNVAVSYQIDGSPKTCWWCTIDEEGFGAAKHQVDPGDAYDADNPRIDTDSDGCFVVFHENAPNEQVWSYIYPDDTRQVLGGEAGADYSDPDIACVSEDRAKAVYTKFAEGNYSGCSRTYDGGWQAQSSDYDGEWTNPVPTVSTVTGDVFYKTAGAGISVTMEDGAFDPVVMERNPYESGGSIAASSDDGSTTHLVVGTQDGAIWVKRTDAVDPWSTGVSVAGTEDEGIVYINGDTALTFEGVADDWDISGTDPLGDSYTDGVTSIVMKYSENAALPTPAWNDLPTDRGSILDDAPWSATVKTGAGGIDEDISFWIRGVIEDTAGNHSETTGGEIILDRTDPTLQVEADGTPNENGWYKEEVTIEISAVDPNLESLEYALCENAMGQTEAWRRYEGPVTLGDGSWSLKARASDKAGNATTSDIHRYPIDTVPPTCEVKRPSGDKMVEDLQGKYRLSGEVTDNNDVVWSGISIDGEKVYETDSMHNMSFLMDTSNMKKQWYTIEVRGTDIAGNTSSAWRESELLAPEDVYGNWYFAEGCTHQGFDEYLCVQNPGNEDAQVEFNFFLEDGSTITESAAVLKGSRATYNIREWVPPNKNVSAHVHSENQMVVVERPIYFNYEGKWQGGHDEIGSNELGYEFYFAEGTTRNNPEDGDFDTWLTILNPAGTDANVQIQYMFNAGEMVCRNHVINAHSRKTIDVENEVGIGKDVSIKVASDNPILAERPIYFNYHNRICGGTTTVGAVSAESSWHFAEGSTAHGFDEWICLQNPGGTEADVKITYMDTEGEVTLERVTIPAQARRTVNVAESVGEADISASVQSDSRIIAERTMYFLYQDKWSGGTCCKGTSELSDQYFFAEGTTREGFDEWICLCNPNGGDGTVYVNYIFGDGTSQAEYYTVMANSRRTISVKDEVGEGKDVSLQVISEFNCPIERPIYFDYDGSCAGGHVATGFLMNNK